MIILGYISFTQFYPWVKPTLLPTFTQFYPTGFTQWVKRTMPTLFTVSTLSVQWWPRRYGRNEHLTLPTYHLLLPAYTYISRDIIAHLWYQTSIPSDSQLQQNFHHCHRLQLCLFSIDKQSQWQTSQLASVNAPPTLTV